MKRYILPLAFTEQRAKSNRSLLAFTAAYLRYRLDRARIRAGFFVKLALTEAYFASAKLKLYFQHGVIRLGSILFLGDPP